MDDCQVKVSESASLEVVPSLGASHIDRVLTHKELCVLVASTSFELVDSGVEHCGCCEVRLFRLFRKVLIREVLLNDVCFLGREIDWLYLDLMAQVLVSAHSQLVSNRFK